MSQLSGADLPANANRRRGYLITLLGVIWLSPDALVLRLIDSETFAVLGWRGGLAALVLIAFLLLRDGPGFWRKIIAQGWPLLVLALSYAINTATFVGAIANSSVADVLVILAATPFVAAALGWLFIRETPTPRTLAAIILGAIGVVIAAAGGVSGGSPLGIFLAVSTTIMLAMQFTLLRVWPHLDNVAAVVIGSIAVAALSFAVSDPFSIEGVHRFWAIVLGLVLTPVAFTLVMIGPRYLPAAEVSLMMLLETALGPLWVWLVLSEAPSLTALSGGVLIIIAVLVAASSAFRRAG